VILTQPNNLTVLTNASALFTVAATGVQPMTYQWRFKGIDLPGETSPMLTLNNVATNRVGDYSVLVTSATGSTLSEGATLAISDNRASTLNALGFVSNQFDLALSGESGTAYRIESSSNLTAWLPQRSFGYSCSLTSSIIFNKTSSAPFSVPAKSTQLYLSASRYSPANEICNNNLKQLRFAKELWARDSYKDRLDTPTVGDLKPYFKQGQFPVCPLGGYYFFYILGWPPACSIAGHILEEP